MGGKRLTYLENRQVEELLRPRVEALGDGFCRYRDSHSDTSVAGEMRMKGVGICTPHHVSAVREQVFGKLRKPADDQRTLIEIADKRIDLMVERTEGLEFQLALVQRDLKLVLDYLTRTQGANWTLEEYKANGQGVQTATASA